MSFHRDRDLMLERVAAMPGTPWHQDFAEHIGTSQDLKQHPESYDFTVAGLACSVRRGGCCTWCGYVTLPAGLDMNAGEVRDTLNAAAHGGLTWETSEQIGFDCGHWGDALPTDGLVEPGVRLPASYIYRDYGFVRSCTERLATAAQNLSNDAKAKASDVDSQAQAQQAGDDMAGQKE